MWPQLVSDALRVALVAGAIVRLLQGDPDTAWLMGLIAVTTIVVRAARAPAAADLLFVGLVSVDVWLTAYGVFDHFNRDDTAGHFLLPAAVTPLLFHLAVRLRILPDGPHRRAALGAAALTIALGTLWELVEWSSDLVLGTNMSLGYTDTMRDLVADTAGALVGAAVLLPLTRRPRRDQI